MEQAPQDNDDAYHAIGWYHVAEAWRLLDQLEREGVDFYIEAPQGDAVSGGAIAAAHSGSFGGDLRFSSTY